DPEKLSLRATMPRFLEMEREHGSVIRALTYGRHRKSETGSNEESGTSGARYSLFLSFQRGMQTLSDRITQVIDERGDQSSNIIAKLNTRVRSLEYAVASPTARAWKIRTANDEVFAVDAICIATPTHVTSKLLSTVDSQLAADIDAISYASTATINFAYKR